ncbi:hypothetical protein DFJ73DRAFT_568459 [Zopfochytrium polystomum]|nr:hypothetical protein DFJ73DRAFT_568459 [Zopfochytrium polystomum]
MHHHHPPLQQPPQHHIHQPPISTRHHQLAIPLQHDLLQRQQQMAQLPSASGDTDPTQDLLAHYLPSSTQAPPASSTDRQPPQQVTDPPNQRAPQVLNPPPPSHSQVNPQAHRPLRHHVNNSGSSVRLGPLLAGIPVVTSGEDYSDDEWSEASLPWTAGRRAPGNGVASQVVAQSAQQPILENRTATATGSDGKTVLVPLPPRTLSIRRDGSSSAALPSTSNPPSAHRPKPSLDSTDMPQFPTCTSTDRSLNPSPPFRNLDPATITNRRATRAVCNWLFSTAFQQFAEHWQRRHLSWWTSRFALLSALHWSSKCNGVSGRSARLHSAHQPTRQLVHSSW